MLIFLLLTLSCVRATLQSIPILDDEEYYELVWSDEYHVKAVKISLLSGLIENIEAWYNGKEQLSRLDYNGGTVKKITDAKKNRRGLMYEIYPVSTEEYTNKIQCTKVRGSFSSPAVAEDILPDASMFEEVGVENIGDRATTKFYQKDMEEKSDTRSIVWAAYDSTKNSWIPVRYEKFEYDPWLGSLSEHMYYEFSDYETVVDKNVFSIIDDYECDYTMDDDKVTKEMKFINPENEAHVDRIFNVFKTKYDRNYYHKKEHEMRKKIFQNSMRLVAATNRKNLGYRLTINRFSDRTEAEMRRFKGLRRGGQEESLGSISFPYTKDEIIQYSTSLPKEFDLRTLGMVSPIRNQGNCGSCWSFGVTAAVEGVIARQNGGRLLRLSEQALVDCDWGFGSTGCDGGYDTSAYKWIMKHGLPMEEEYGLYLAQDGYCLIENMTETYRIKGFTKVTPYSIAALKVAVVNHGPLSVSIDASTVFSAYSNGILYDPDCHQDRANHIVSLVGYGERYGEPYWILKNSYGTEWGDDGYIYISMRDNNCGVASSPVYPVV